MDEQRVPLEGEITIRRSCNKLTKSDLLGSGGILTD